MKNLWFILISLIIVGCTTPASQATPLNDESMLLSVLWTQTSAEYQALAHQAYNLAHLRLDASLTRPHSKPLAIIADIDETVLNNTFYNAKEILVKQHYPDDFYAWIDSARGLAIPGALKFTTYAASKGVTIFYVTNRRTRGAEGTIRNLRKLGFPNADSAHVLMKTNTSSKEPRRQRIMADYDVVLLLGDNLVDFIDAGKASVAERSALVDEHRDDFGNRFIILPNPMHGSWKKALYNFKTNLTPEDIRKQYLSHLQTF